MLNIKLYINKLLDIICKKFQKSKRISNTNQSSEYKIAELSFQLTNDSNIDIAYSLPEFTHLTAEQMLILSEKYAKFLMIINDGLLKEDIIQTLENSVKNSENPDDHLFWENVMINLGILHVEALSAKKQKDKKDQPTVRPLYAFGRTSH